MYTRYARNLRGDFSSNLGSTWSMSNILGNILDIIQDPKGYQAAIDAYRDLTSAIIDLFSRVRERHNANVNGLDGLREALVGNTDWMNFYDIAKARVNSHFERAKSIEKRYVSHLNREQLVRSEFEQDKADLQKLLKDSADYGVYLEKILADPSQIVKIAPPGESIFGKAQSLMMLGLVGGLLIFFAPTIKAMIEKKK